MPQHLTQFKPGKWTTCNITRIWHIKTRAHTVIKKMCQIYISCCVIIWLYIQGFFLSLRHVRLPSMCFHLSVRLWTQLLKMGSRVFGRVCQARETDSPKPGFQALRHLVSSSQTFFLERPDLICSLAVNYASYCNYENSRNVCSRGISSAELLLWLSFSKALGPLLDCLWAHEISAT